jgi:hypothetical protein
MKKKLELSELKVQSFVTQVRNSDQLKGGETDVCINPESLIITNCCTGIYPTLPVQNCGTGTNGYNCPCDAARNSATCVEVNLSHIGGGC